MGCYRFESLLSIKEEPPGKPPEVMEGSIRYRENCSPPHDYRVRRTRRS